MAIGTGRFLLYDSGLTDVTRRLRVSLNDVHAFNEHLILLEIHLLNLACLAPVSSPGNQDRIVNTQLHVTAPPGRGIRCA